MKKMKKMKKMGIIALAVISISSCQKESFTPTVSEGNYENGYFVTNEGNFGTGNGSISFISNEGDVENDVFSQINSFQLGDVVQSMSIINNTH